MPKALQQAASMDLFWVGESPGFFTTKKAEQKNHAENKVTFFCPDQTFIYIIGLYDRPYGLASSQ